jgi:protein-tyrosine phosphatase
VIDIHSHVLWDLDDGADTMEDSLSMLRAAAADGTTDIVATPHCNAQYVYDAELVARRMAILAANAGGQPKIHRGCEFHLNYDNLDRLLRGHALYTINGGRYLLLECPDFHVGKHTEAVLERLVDAGLVPILAHPERNPVLQQSISRLDRWVEFGCLTQVTSLSITGAFGSPPRAAAMRFLDRGLVHIVASDAHDPTRRHPCMSQARELVRRRAGEDAAELLFRETPRAVIENRPVGAGRMPVADHSRRWWPFA